MRGREFLMKDMYSYHRSQEDLDAFYEKAILAYKNVYARAGIGDRTYLTFASGGMFSKFSHEFQTVCDAGEDVIYIDDEKGIAVNDEVMEDDVLAGLGIKRENLRTEKSIEVGNIFKYATRYTSELGVTYKDGAGKETPVVNGAYGIGLGRLMGTIVELLADDKGLVWPEAVAPFRVHLLSLGEDEIASKLYDELTVAGVETLFDDRDVRAGEKFADSDLLGVPYRLTVGRKMREGGMVEIKRRTGDETDAVPIENTVVFFAS
jgi:prolyl-tRNA synthetase